MTKRIVLIETMDSDVRMPELSAALKKLNAEVMELSLLDDMELILDAMEAGFMPVVMKSQAGWRG